jgi:hypothetical protein
MRDTIIDFISNLKPLAYLVLLSWTCMSFFACSSDPKTEESQNSTKVDPLILEDYRSPEQKMGFLDDSANIAIPAQFDEVRAFSEGFAAVNIQGLWGYINTKGKRTVFPQYLGAWSFNNDRAKVQSAQNRKVGYIDARGDTIINLTYDEGGNYQFGFVPVKKGQYWGLLDVEGNSIMDAEYYALKVLSPDWIAAKITEEWSIYHLSSKEWIQSGLSQVFGFRNGVFRVKDKKGEYYYLDTDGEPLLSEASYKLYPPQDGVLTRCEQKNKCYLINQNGATLSDTYDEIRPLGESRFAIYQSNKWGLINDLGAVILPPQFEQLYSFSDGFAPYQKDDLWGFIDREGRRVTSNIFGLAWPFENGMARVLTSTGMAYLTRDLELRKTPPSVAEIRSYSESLAAFKESPKK